MGGNVVGWEISKTATSKAMKNFPLISFKNKNIMIANIDEKYDLISISEVLWYLLDDIESIFNKIYNGLTDDGLLAIHQYFPKNQKFGKDIINGLEEFEKFICEHTQFKFIDKMISFTDEDRVLLAVLKKDR